MGKNKRLFTFFMAIVIMISIMSCNTMAAVSINADMVFNFTSGDIAGAVNMNDGNVPVYNSQTGYGFVSQTNAMPARKVNINSISHNDGGFTITEDGTGSYIHNTNTNSYNYGGLVFRIDVEEAAAYGITVKLNGCTSTDTAVAVNGMNASRITSNAYWDSAKTVKIQNYAKWTDNTTWQYDFVAGEKYIEIEIEPASMPKSSAPATVGIESVSLTKLSNNVRVAGEKPTVYVLGDSTQKTYTFEEAAMSGWGQIIYKMFDADKINVINYSMGGRSMKTMFNENRFNDVLMTANEGDYVFIHSAHNDESTGASEGAEARFGRGSNTETYTRWLNDIYISSMRARGLIPVLVTAMPRTTDGVYNEGFNPDSPSIMKAAAANADVECIDLYENAKKYIDLVGAEQTKAIYMSIEAGETPGKTNSGSYANGHPDNKIDGTHYKEAAAKVWCKIIAEEIYNGASKADASEALKSLALCLDTDVTEAIKQGDWTKVFPEWSNDVTFAVSGDGSYYRNQIEKLIQLGVLAKDENNNFRPAEKIITNDFIAALCALWGLDCEELSAYYSTTSMTREEMASIILAAYKLRFGYDKDGNLYKPPYMTNYNGSTITPDDPNYDPNLTGAEAQYYPLVGWGNITDKNDISLEYAEDFYTVYNLGLVRSEKDIARGRMKNGTELEPKTEVTRAKAAKELWFLWVLGQNNVLEENQVSTIYNKSGEVQNIAYKAVNYSVADYEFDNVNIDSNGRLSVTLKVNTANAAAKLKADIYNADNSLKEAKEYTVLGSNVMGMDITLTEGEYVIMSITDGTSLLSEERKAVCTKLIVPVRSYTAETAPGIKNGKLALANLTEQKQSLSAFSVTTAEDGTVWWKASENVTMGTPVSGFDNLAPTYDMNFTALSRTINGVSFTGYVAHATKNGYVDGSGSGFNFTPSEDGVITAYVSNLGATKNFIIVESGKTASEAVASSLENGLSGDCAVSAVLKAGTTYHITVLGSKGRFLGISYSAGAPIVNTLAKAGEIVEITATPDSGYMVDNVKAVDTEGNEIALISNSDKSVSTFVMPESNVTISAVFAESGVSSEMMWGDADESGVLTSNDSAVILLHVVDSAEAGLSDKVLKYCDVNGDGIITAGDAANVLDKVLTGDLFEAER